MPEEATERDRMLAKPYNPGGKEVSPDWRQTVATEYIALYLGEINEKLGWIAARLEEQQANAGSIVQQLERIAARPR